MNDERKEKLEEKLEETKRVVSEEVDMAADKAMNWIREAVREGNVRRIIVRTKDGRTLFDTTLTMGAAAGGLLFFAGWPLIALTAVAALAAQVRVEVVRELTDEDDGKGKRTRIQIKDEE